jgi:hypothetical protein
MLQQREGQRAPVLAGLRLLQRLELSGGRRRRNRSRVLPLNKTRSARSRPTHRRAISRSTAEIEVVLVIERLKQIDPQVGSLLAQALTSDTRGDRVKARAFLTARPLLT